MALQVSARNPGTDDFKPEVAVAPHEIGTLEMGHLQSFSVNAELPAGRYPQPFPFGYIRLLGPVGLVGRVAQIPYCVPPVFINLPIGRPFALGDVIRRIQGVPKLFQDAVRRVQKRRAARRPDQGQFKGVRRGPQVAQLELPGIVHVLSPGSVVVVPEIAFRFGGNPVGLIQGLIQGVKGGPQPRQVTYVHLFAALVPYRRRGPVNAVVRPRQGRELLRLRDAPDIAVEINGLLLAPAVYVGYRLQLLFPVMVNGDNHLAEPGIGDFLV